MVVMKRFHNSNVIKIVILVFIFDQISKYLLKSFLELGQTLSVIPNILHLTPVHNMGAGFGILQGQRLFFILFSIIVLAVLIYKWKKMPEEMNIIVPLGLVIGGLLGNLLDRIILGYVFDFIDFRIWPVFNAADSAISIGVVWLIIYLWTGKKDNKKKK